MSDRELFTVRVALLQAFLHANRYDGILLSRADNFAMATGGKRNYVSTASDLGASSIFITRAGRVYFVGNNIETPRVMAEELAGLGIEERSFLWFKDNAAGLVRREFAGTLASDDGSLGENVNGKLAELRALLTEPELEKYRRLGQLAAEAMTAAINSAEVGMTEAEVAAVLVAEGGKRRCLVPVALIAADERIARFRHPLPTQTPLLGEGLAERKIRGYVMVVGSFLREGLVVSITRLKRVGPVPTHISGMYKRICGVDALLQEATEQGKTLGHIFAACQGAYAAMGFPKDDWHNHHQGGTTGYAGRTCKASPTESFRVLNPFWAERVRDILGRDTPFGCAFAWNPSATGVKSEDTFILLPDGAKEIVTRTPALPQVDLGAVLGRATDVVKSDMAD